MILATSDLERTVVAGREQRAAPGRGRRRAAGREAHQQQQEERPRRGWTRVVDEASTKSPHPSSKLLLDSGAIKVSQSP